MVKIKIFDYDTNPSTATPILIFERIVIKILRYIFDTSFETRNMKQQIETTN